MNINRLTVNTADETETLVVQFEPGLNKICGSHAEQEAQLLAGALAYTGLDNKKRHLTANKSVDIDIAGLDNESIEEFDKALERQVSLETRGCCLFTNEESQHFERRLLQYRLPGNYYEDDEFTSITSGYGNMGVFRAYLREYISEFEPKTIDKNKEIYLVIDRSGEFMAVKKYGDRFRKAVLSEKNQVIFRFLIFLELVRFWDGALELKSPDYIKMPLIISGLEKLRCRSDELKILFDEASMTGHQVLVFCQD